MSIELVSFSTLKNLLGLEGAVIGDYPDLALLRESVTAAIEAYIGRELEQIARTETVTLTDTCIIPLKGLPILTISAITVDDEDLTTADYQAMNYGILLHKNLVEFGNVFSITYTGGYLTAATPNPIQRAALFQTVFEFQSKEHVGATYVSTEGGSVTRPNFGLLEEVKSLLNGYKHPLLWT